MTNAEIEQLKEIKRVKEAMGKTDSHYLFLDYKKYLTRLIKELNEYRKYRYGQKG